MNVLHLDSSARRNRSHTRKLSQLLIDELRVRIPDMNVVRRDLATVPPPAVTENWIAAAFSKQTPLTPEMKQALRVSDELIDELLSCDLYVIGAPMYNLSVPSVLKSYIDQIVRVGRTFLFEPERSTQPYTGLVSGKRAVVVTARGDAGYGPDGPQWLNNHSDRYIADVLRFLGVEDIETVAVENDEFGGRSLRQSVEAAEARIRDLAEEIAEAHCLLRPCCGCAAG